MMVLVVQDFRQENYFVLQKVLVIAISSANLVALFRS